MTPHPDPEGIHPSRSPYDWCDRRPAYEVCKRLMDIVIAVVVLTALSPLWLAIALSIRVTSPGPALFKRTVVGKHGVPFTYFKFRTMVAGDDKHHREWLRKFVEEDASYEGGDFKVRNDPRITSVGRVLRRTSLDEVPQFINVLLGDMSVIGPRPPIEFEFALYDLNAKRRLAVKPGISGLYQVTARGRAPFSEMLALDLQYIQQRSLRLDLELIARTAAAMFQGA